MPSSWSIKLAGTCRPASSCPQTSPSLRCRQNAPSSIRSKTSGSLCATTGFRTASSNPTTISSTIAATLGTSSSISPGASCPSDCANGRTGSDQRELVLGVVTSAQPYLLLNSTAAFFGSGAGFGVGPRFRLGNGWGSTTSFVSSASGCVSGKKEDGLDSSAGLDLAACSSQAFSVAFALAQASFI